MDNIVPVGESERMVNALKNAGGEVRFTVYPFAGHEPGPRPITTLSFIDGFWNTRILAAALVLPAVHGEDADYWPGQDWRMSVPEEQGIDTEKLVQMLKYLQSAKADLHSVLIIRHGYLVAESYLDPYTRDDPHKLMSVSKSFLSALTGVALRERSCPAWIRSCARSSPSTSTNVPTRENSKLLCGIS